METRANKIGSSATHSTGIINGHAVRGCIRIPQEAAPVNQSCVAPMKFQSQAFDYQGGRALSCLVVVGGGRHDPRAQSEHR
jgi:hypothetical protein